MAGPVGREEIVDALANVANDHDPVRAVERLLARAWSDGYCEGWREVSDALNDEPPAQAVNPYGMA